MRLVERLVANLVDNALCHNVDHGRIDVTTSTAAGHAVLTVDNTGPVVSAEDIEQLFEPFRTSADADRTRLDDGHGLGLSIVRAIADAHGAIVAAEPSPEGGLRVEVRFPFRGRRSSRRELRESPGRVDTQVLTVDRTAR